MLKREDMLELTRRMTPQRTGFDRVAGCYFDEEGYAEGTFNVHFLNLTPAEKKKNLAIAKTIPFAETNVQLTELDFPGETRQSGDMMRLLDAMKEAELKNDALLETFYEVASEHLPKGASYGIFLFHGSFDIPRIGSDKSWQWESEEVYDYLICAVMQVSGAYEPEEPFSGFLYPSFYDRGADLFHIALYEKIPGVSGEGLASLLGCER